MSESLKKVFKYYFIAERCTCELCRAETFNSWICPDCDEQMPYNLGITCPVCGRRTPKSQLCHDCVRKIPKFNKGVSALVYNGAAIELVMAYKHGKRYLSNYFCELLVPKINELPPFDCIVYVPMTRERQRKRRYNQSKLLAEKISKNLQKPVLNVIEKVAETPDQKGLTRDERYENLKTCFKITDRKACKGKTFLLVDDVLTTGATADAVCEKLKKAGAKEMYVATVASVEYKPRPAAIKEDKAPS